MLEKDKEHDINKSRNYVVRRKKIMKIKEDTIKTSKKENRKTIDEINETKNLSFKKFTGIDKPLNRLTRKKGEKPQSTKIFVDYRIYKI